MEITSDTGKGRLYKDITLSLEGFGDEQEKRKMHADVTVSTEVPKV